MNKWLEEDIEDITILEERPNYDVSQLADHYTDNDPDLNPFDMSFLRIIDEAKRDEEMTDYLHLLDKSTLYYTDNKNRKRTRVLIKPDTKRYHVSYLFRKLIDTVREDKMDVTFDDAVCPLIDKSCKNAFYEFCHINE